MLLFLKIFAIAGFLLTTITGRAAPQNKEPSEIQSIEQIEASRRALISKALKLSKDEERKFWPIYDRYERERHLLIVARMQFMKSLSAHYDEMHQTDAQEFIEGVISTDENAVKLWRKYIPEIINAIDDVKAARFIQIEKRIKTFIDARLGKDFPIIR